MTLECEVILHSPFLSPTPSFFLSLSLSLSLPLPDRMPAVVQQGAGGLLFSVRQCFCRPKPPRSKINGIVPGGGNEVVGIGTECNTTDET